MSMKYVWDPLVRLFHWSLVGAFTVSYLTGDEESALHTNAGYLILALLVARVVWGLFGTRHARFSDFLFSPVEALRYLRDLLSDKADIKRYLGHSPVGAMMVFALLISLSLTIFSGLKLEAIEGHGLLAETTEIRQESGFVISTAQADDDMHDYGEHENEDEEVEEFWEEIHEFFANLTLLLVFLHVTGVIISGIRHNENLVKAMFTGYKKSK